MYPVPQPQQGIVHHSHMNNSSLTLPPPTPTTASAAEFSGTYSALPTLPPRPPPPRREHAIQPPALTTSLSGAAYRSGGPPPTPATMSSPFMPSSVPLSGMSSPMSARPGGYHAAAPYNPQQWGPIGANNSASPQIGIGLLTPMTTPMSTAASRGLADELSRSGAPPGPPPPYSPPRSSSQAPSPRVVQPTTMSPGYPHQSSHSPAQQHVSSSAYGSSADRRRPSSMIFSGNPSTPQHGGFPPPPPGGLNTSLPSTSRHHVQAHRGNAADPISPGRISPDLYNDAMPGIPPGSRRAASTGDLERTHGYARSRRWEPGMPLPPPPPGPPPRGTSPATNPTPNEYAYNSAPRERTRRPPPLGMNLPTVPPTPADWRDTEDTTQASDIAQRVRRQSNAVSEQQIARQYSPELSHDNDTVTPAQSASDTHSTTSSNRTATTSGKGIRERRIETRLGNAPTTGGPSESSSSNQNSSAWPPDLILANPGTSSLSRRRTVTKSTPRSARSNPEEPRGSATLAKSPLVPRTAGTDEFPTPRGLPATRRESDPSTTMQTPPFSPGLEGRRSPHVEATDTKGDVSRNSNPRTLPTPPLSVPPDSSRSLVASPRQDRPVSHLLHLPVDESPTHAPLVPRKLSTRKPRSEPTEDFVRESEQRYREFLVKEASACSDAEGLKAFCDFIIEESAIRRRRYESVWATGSFDLDHLISNLFPAPESPSPRNPPQDLNLSDRTSTTQPSPSLPSLPPSPAIPSRLTVDTGPWQYRPTLSPIASMSISNDEMSSRGRAPSRWWESQAGSESGGGKAPAVHRTKRETKYMGLPREMREAMQLEVEAMGMGMGMGENNGDACRGAEFPVTNPFAGYGPNEYPPEKGGGASLRRAPSNSREKLDISRLVTLPPSYPRHYPAVNNNHPDLSFYRSTVRSVSDLSEVKVTKQGYEDRVKELREKYEARLQEERRNFRAGVNCGIEEGSISYAEAAEAEAVRKTEEHEQERELVQAEFDLFQEEVYKPMRSIISDRINIASTCIDELRSKLFDSAQHSTPNQTQEGGDEQPELLEKLTQLKWLFESRETLYREEFTLQTEHDDKYRNLVTLPYHQTKNADKLSETEAFFTRDAQDRALNFATDTFHRFESFLSVIDENVTRGVEAQLSAFWDIAPSLLELLQCVPDDLSSTSNTYFAIKIPQEEYDENPSYFRHPLQYLYSLVSHAEKSTFQFIEAQTNLFCLLHEVRSGVLNAKCRATELWRVYKQGEKTELVGAELRAEREKEERVLTADLQDKVGMVEEQWDEALGRVMTGVKDRVKRVLEEEGGWEEMVQMEMEQA